MTQTTDSRQLRLTVESILSKYRIDNLQLSIEIVDAVKTFFAETKTGHNPAEVRQKIAEAIEIGERNASAREDMRNRIEIALHLNLLPNAEGMIDFCLRKEKEGQTIEEYAEWCRRDPYNSPKAHQIANKPDLVISTWPQAFVQVNTNKEHAL
jgi:hypothetical protein